MKHYVCLGDCNTESSTPGVCNMSGCTKEGEELAACECEDGLHEEVKGPGASAQEIEI